MKKYWRTKSSRWQNVHRTSKCSLDETSRLFRNVGIHQCPLRPHLDRGGSQKTNMQYLKAMLYSQELFYNNNSSTDTAQIKTFNSTF
jgi:hypothetical protein